jgi:transcriptional regulator with XRE-family HTH domain
VVGKRIRELRKERKLNQEEFAKLLNTSQEYVSNLEKGKKNPRLSTLQKIAKILKVNIQDLFCD